MLDELNNTRKLFMSNESVLFDLSYIFEGIICCTIYNAKDIGLDTNKKTHFNIPKRCAIKEGKNIVSKFIKILI